MLLLTDYKERFNNKPMKNYIKKYVKKIPGATKIYLEWLEIIKIIDIIYYNKICLQRNLRRIRKKIEKGEKVNVGFSAWNVAMWKYDRLYKLLSKDDRFNVFLILIPSPLKNDMTRKQDLESMLKEFGNREYNIYPIIQDDKNIQFDFDEELKKTMDIFFPTQQYLPERIKNNISRYIICYSKYSFHNVRIEKWAEDTFLCNIMWKYFVETDVIIQESKDKVFNRARNRITTGFLFGDELIDKTIKHNPWKQVGDEKKRIIWAPHFSVDKEHVLQFSNFLDLSEKMLELAEKYKDDIQIAFKPHPFLYNALCDEEIWGKEKTDKYYNTWETLDNGQLVTGGYIDLFKVSDALIHDSGSFTVEYLYMHKPVMYITKDISKRSKDKISEQALKCHYIGQSIEDINRFIKNVVICGNDVMYENREIFYNKYLIPPNGLTAAENAYNNITESLF